MGMASAACGRRDSSARERGCHGASRWSRSKSAVAVSDAGSRSAGASGRSDGEPVGSLVTTTAAAAAAGTTGCCCNVHSAAVPSHHSGHGVSAAASAVIFCRRFASSLASCSLTESRPRRAAVRRLPRRCAKSSSGTPVSSAARVRSAVPASGVDYPQVLPPVRTCRLACNLFNHMSPMLESLCYRCCFPESNPCQSGAENNEVTPSWPKSLRDSVDRAHHSRSAEIPRAGHAEILPVPVIFAGQARLQAQASASCRTT